MCSPRFLLTCFVLAAVIKPGAEDLLKIRCKNAPVELWCSQERNCCLVDDETIRGGGSGCADEVETMLRRLNRKPCGSPTGPPVVQMLSPGQVDISPGKNVSLVASLSSATSGNCTWAHGSSTAKCANASVSERVRVTSVTRSTQSAEGNTLTKERVTEVALHITEVTDQDAGIYLLQVCSVTGCHTAHYNVTVRGASTTPPALANATEVNNGTELPPPSDDSPNHVAIIVEAVVGVMVFIAIVAMVGCCISGLRKHRRKNEAAIRVNREVAHYSDDSVDFKLTDLVSED